MNTAPTAQNPWLLVARREVMTKLTDKAFLVGTAITLVLITGFIGWSVVSEGDTETYDVVATAGSLEAATLLEEGASEVGESVRVDVRQVGTESEGEAALRSGDADVLLRPADDGWVLVGDEGVPGDLEQVATTVLRDAALAANAADAGTTLGELQAGSDVSTDQLQGDAERQGFAEAMGVALAFLFYFAALGFGYTLAGSITEEKSSRVVEIITTKIPVRQLLVGKIAGNTVLAIGQTALLVTVGLIGVSFTEYSTFLPALTGGIGWFVAFFVIGFCFLACWWAVAGALASRAEDLQTTATPLSFLMMGVFFGSFFFEGSALTVASYVPPFSCVLMPIRLLQGDAGWWEPVVAIVILAAAMAATVVLAERLYRRALLQTQGRVSLKQAWTAAD